MLSLQVDEDDRKSEISSMWTTMPDGTGGGGVDQNLGDNHTEDLRSYEAAVKYKKGADCVGFECVRGQEGQGTIRSYVLPSIISFLHFSYSACPRKCSSSRSKGFRSSGKRWSQSIQKLVLKEIEMNVVPIMSLEA